LLSGEMIMQFVGVQGFASLGLSVLFTPSLTHAQSQIFAYPGAGQSEEQQSRDRFERHQWLVGQTGFDPTTAPPLPARAVAPPPSQNDNQGYSRRAPRRGRGFLGIGDGGFFEGGGMVGDAATGAALGAVSGALAGDAGQGAAIGALASTVFGVFSRQAQQQPQQYQAQQAQADRAHMDRIEQVDEYNRAYGACMRSLEYTIN
jgi:hypothetical protein